MKDVGDYWKVTVTIGTNNAKVTGGADGVVIISETTLKIVEILKTQIRNYIFKLNE